MNRDIKTLEICERCMLDIRHFLEEQEFIIIMYERTHNYINTQAIVMEHKVISEWINLLYIVQVIKFHTIILFH